MVNKYLFATLLFCAFSLSLFGQYGIHRQVRDARLPDSLDISFYSKKNGLGAAAQVFSINMGLWGFNRYVTDKHYAYISMNTIKDNLKKGFVWDNDGMGNNMFLHPYHGNLYFNSARSRGYNFWESSAFTLAGSAMWELFMENEYPSFNDIIATPVGGQALGEVLYRTSDLVLDDRKTGRQRFGHELAGFLIAPTRGITRILNGDAWRKRSTSGKQFGVPKVSVEVSTGIRALELKGKVLDKGVGLASNINIEYGERFTEDTEKPFDYFTFNACVNAHSSQPILSQLNIIGRLYASELIDNEKDYLSLGFYQHFDYYDSDTISSVSGRIPYKISAPASAGLGFIYKSKRSRNFSFNAYLHLNLVLLGGSLSDHYVVDMRDYNLASGFSSKSGFNFSYKDKFSLTYGYEVYRMFTWKGYPHEINWNSIDPHEFNFQGDNSQSTLHAISFRGDVKLRDRLYLTAIGYNFTRDTNYRYFEDVFSQTSEGRIMLTYQF